MNAEMQLPAVVLSKLSDDELIDRLVATAGRHNEMDCTAALTQLEAEVRRRLRAQGEQ